MLFCIKLFLCFDGLKLSVGDVIVRQKGVVAEIRTHDLPHPSKYASIYPQDHGALAEDYTFTLLAKPLKNRMSFKNRMQSTIRIAVGI